MKDRIVILLIAFMIFMLSLSAIWAIYTHTNEVAKEQTEQEQIWVNGCLELRASDDQVNCLLLIKPEER